MSLAKFHVTDAVVSQTRVKMSRMLSLLTLFLLLITIQLGKTNDCVPRQYKFGIVCVCNATFCDSTPELDLPSGNFVHYESSESGARMVRRNGVSSSSFTGHVTIDINAELTYQSIVGFGGAFTDATGINVMKLSADTREKLMQTYFGATGSRYSVGRVPIAGTDFSDRPYTYDDNDGDVSLEKFNLTSYDSDYKIPFMKEAQALSPSILFMAAAWSAPPWMKTNNDYKGFGFLKDNYYQTYANYLIKFLDAYNQQGLKMTYLSTGNEPSSALIPIKGINSLAWLPSGMGDWVANNLGPTLTASKHKDVKIITLDDQRFLVPIFIHRLFKNKVAMDYISGIAVHWYWDNIIPASLLEDLHNSYPEKFIIMSEASNGDKPWDFTKVELGSWNRGLKYFNDIRENLEHWSIGWVDWNMALDAQGGPTWNKNHIDSAIIVIPESDEFLKQPMYYAIHHYSRFIPRDSLRVQSSSYNTDIKPIAFVTPGKDSVIVAIYNKSSKNETITIRDQKFRGVINLTLQPNSMNTVIYKY